MAIYQPQFDEFPLGHKKSVFIHFYGHLQLIFCSAKAGPGLHHPYPAFFYNCIAFLTNLLHLKIMSAPYLSLSPEYQNFRQFPPLTFLIINKVYGNTILSDE